MTEPEPPPSGPSESPSVRAVDYKGAPLDSEKGPGLGCFWTQLAVLAVLLVLTPLSVAWSWPFWISGGLLILVLLLLLLAGQTVIFLLRLVAADRRAAEHSVAGRRRPLASPTPTVGELEDRTTPPEAPIDDAAPTGPADGGVRE
ncbi:MAG: hypothetical protein A2V84_05670 [Chloroflexi bacterium RBG_16_70_13]|nr:MAG: hypothetical protein A2V84_05670 [Chloroflexi bacterium RBG_16_70_13]